MDLTPQEQQWRDDLRARLEKFPMEGTYEQRDKAHLEMRDIAVQLHVSLKSRGHEPEHTKQMIKNRGLHPDHSDFYLHLHPIEDLVAFAGSPTPK